MIDEKCRCICHRSGNATISEHVAPCCIKCHFCSKNIPTHSISEHKKRCASLFLGAELEYFEQHRIEWFENYAGKFALIQGTTLCGFFSTYSQALGVGWSFGTSFLVKEVQLKDEMIFMPRTAIDLFDGIQNDYVI